MSSAIDRERETSSQKTGPGTRKAGPNHQMCCVYWCREMAAVMVPLGDKEYGACRIHAAFIRAGKLDWFDR